MEDKIFTLGEERKAAVEFVDLYMKSAIQRIDKQFGKGYAKENPALLSGFIQACAVAAFQERGFEGEK